jgi:Holliday junction DNA helicase RuvB
MQRKNAAKKVEPLAAPVMSDLSLDHALRPSRWDEYIGQENIKENLRILLTAAKEREHAPEHLLFYGPPGLGKTTLAHLIAKEINTQIKITSGPAIERVGDLASILTNLSSGDILFIDEVHRLSKQVEEILYPAMESGRLDIIIGKGPSARTVQLDLPPFTLIAATTRISLLSSPLRSRFSGGTFRLEYYTKEEIEKILRRSANILGITSEDGSLKEIAARSRFTPRTANYLLKRARDFAQVHPNKNLATGTALASGGFARTSRPKSSKENDSEIFARVKRPPVLTKELVLGALKLLGVDELGLHHADRALLTVLIEKFGGGPVGLNTLSAALSEEEATIEEVHEPYLIQLGLLERTPRGRRVTPDAFTHLQGFKQTLL